jgi:hypothetical protein
MDGVEALSGEGDRDRLMANSVIAFVEGGAAFAPKKFSIPR